ncbi:MAG: hypothetical protein PHS53_01020 [Candidatus Pacebacteria bacterium]|nr:hypothetical protein [Candidatus Paceibacterota bacterium]
MDEKVFSHVGDLRQLDLRTAENSVLCAVLGRTSAGDFMGECVKALAARERIPEDLKNIPGIGFWPVPLYFPLILARTLFLLEQTIGTLRTEREWSKAKKLAEARKIFVHLSCGQELVEDEQMSDLSGDHCSVFLEDHPAILRLERGTEKNLPWWPFCQSLLAKPSVFRLLGAVSDNEDGSMGEVHALAETGLLADGKFFRLHSVAEEEHARLAKQMEEIILSEPEWSHEYLVGKVQHRMLYAQVAGV